MNGIQIIQQIDSFRAPESGRDSGADVQHKPRVDADREPSREELEHMVSQLNKKAQSFNERVQFSYHEKINRVIIKVIDSDTNEIKREIPARDMIALLEHIEEHLGILFDESR